jgi:ADP-heptose:LPS heptosyltransferase
MYFNFSKPVRISHVQLARLALERGGADINIDTALLPFEINEKIHSSAAEKLDKLIGSSSYKGFIGINVNASELSFARRWPIERFAQTAGHFAKEGYCVLLFGSPQEKEYTQKLITLSPDNNIFNVAGYFSLTEVLSLLAKLDCFLTNDTGLMNLAYAQKAKVVSIYGNNSPQMVHVDNGINIALYRDSYCSPCLYIFDTPPCGDRQVCMLNVNTDEVICAVKKVIETPREKMQLKEMSHMAVVDENSGYILGELNRGVKI